MLALTLIRLFRDALLFVAAVCVVIPIIGGIDAADAYLSGWQQVELNGEGFLWLLYIACISFAGWFLVQRHEKIMARTLGNRPRGL